MKIKLIIFGVDQTAELAKYYIEKDYPNVEIVAFTVHNQFMPQGYFFCDKPVVPFEELKQTYRNDEHMLFAPMTGSGMNSVRERVYRSGKQKGYRFYTYVSPKATLNDNQIGDNCFILEDNTIQPFTSIGNNCVLWSGNHLGHHSRIGNNVFFTSHCVLSGNCEVGDYSWFGVNCTIRDFTKIAEGTFVAAGALVTKNTDQNMGYLGAPAKPFKPSMEMNP